MTDYGDMAGEVLDLVPEPEQSHDDWLLRFRARIATDIADGRRSDMVFSDLVTAAADRISGATAAIITIDTDDLAQVAATSLPPTIAGLIHSTRRRNWFGSWAASISRHTTVCLLYTSPSPRDRG